MTAVAGKDVPTPELDRFLAAIKPEPVNDTLSAFIDWLGESNYQIVSPGDITYDIAKCCPNESCQKGVDDSLLNPRQRQVFEEVYGDDFVEYLERHPELRCQTCDGSRYVRHQKVVGGAGLRFPRPAEVIAAFLGLDEDKMEDERRALLEALRA